MLCTSPRDLELARSDSRGNDYIRITTPLSVLSLCTGAEEIGMDEEEFCSPMTQRVYQYLKKHSAGGKMDKFMYDKGRKKGSVKDFLKIVLR